MPARHVYLRLLLTLGLAVSTAHAGVLVSTDFSSPLPVGASAYGGKTQPDGKVTASQSLTAEGTTDTYQGKPSPALTLTADLTLAKGQAKAGLSTGLLAVTNPESDLGKLSLGFDLWTSTPHPVRVFLKSYDATGALTGVRAALVVPPVAGAFYRFSLDLDKTQPTEGKFDPCAPQIEFAFELNDADAPAPLPRVAGPVLRIDNLSYTAPSFYVSARGDDANPGLTAKTPFATLQRAINVAKAGDVILMMDGTYTALPGANLAEIPKRGRPDKWIVIRACPGHQPVLTGTGWNVLSLNQDSAYIELRDLTVRGQRTKFTVEQALADTKSKGPSDSKFNTNGIALDSRKGGEKGGKAHHIRIINCTIFDMPGGGLSAIAGDHITIEGNHIYENAHLMRYAGSGISVFRAWDFDADTGYKNFVIGNRTHGNRCFIPWDVVGRVSDGNGIIIDDCINSQNGASKIPYKGRTLVMNNLTYGNGGSGIHAYASNHVDIVNNTAYYNAQSPELVWRQIYAGGKCIDVRIVNNILYAQRGRPLDFSVSKDSKEIIYSHNLSYGDGDNDVKSGGGLGTGPAGTGSADKGDNLLGDPRFLRPSLNATVADFHVAPNSPAVDAGTADYGFAPIRDLDGRPRPQGAAIDIGAYESPPPR